MDMKLPKCHARNKNKEIKSDNIMLCGVERKFDATKTLICAKIEFTIRILVTSLNQHTHNVHHHMRNNNNTHHNRNNGRMK